MSRTTKIANLAGRVIESVSVFHDDGNENPLGLEIRCVGGAYFAFEVAAEVKVWAVSTLADNRTGTLRNKRGRKFMAEGTFPYAPPEVDD